MSSMSSRFFLVGKAIQSAILKVTNLLVSKADP